MPIHGNWVSQTFLTIKPKQDKHSFVRCSLNAKHSELKREFGAGDPYWDPKPKPPPRLYAVWVYNIPLGNREGYRPSCRKPGDRPAICVKPPVGCDRFRRLNYEYQNKRNSSFNTGHRRYCRYLRYRTGIVICIWIRSGDSLARRGP